MHLSRQTRSVLTLAVLATALEANTLPLPPQGPASTITILDIGHSGTTADGTVFRAGPNPTSPSTGTGVFEPFVRTQAVGSSPNTGERQSGYNTDVGEPATNFDTKGGSAWTRSIELAEVGRVMFGNVPHYQFLLDANEEGSSRSVANQIDIVDVQIYLGSDPMFRTPELGSGYTGTPFDSSDNSLLNTAPVWSLDNATNGDVTVLLQASICASNGQCGSGHGDLEMLIPVSLFGGLPTDRLVFYVEYDRAARPSGGFEEWSTRTGSCAGCCINQAAVLSVGAGCAPAALTIPTLTSIGLPTPGGPIGVDIHSPDTQSSFGIVAYGFSSIFDPRFNLPLPIDLGQFGFPGCSLNASSEFQVGLVTNGHGEARHSFNIPALTKWCEREITFQAFFLSGSLELLSSAGLTTVIGS